VPEVALHALSVPRRGKGRHLAAADLEPDLALPARVPVVGVDRIDAPGQAILGFVVAVVGHAEPEPVKRLLERLHHGEDHVFVVVFFDPREIQIGREAPPAADEHLAKAGSALEGELVQDAALRHQLEQEGEHDLVFGDHDVAQSGFDGVALDLGTGENGSALPADRSRPRDAGAVAQFVAGDVGGELPTFLISDCAGFGGSRAEICSAATLRKVLKMRAHVFGDGGAGTLCQPSEASRERLGGHALQITGRLGPVDAAAGCRQDGRRFSFAAGEVRTVDAVDGGLFAVGHHDGVAQDVDRAESEEFSWDRIDDADLGIEHAAVARAHRRDQSNDLAVLRCEAVVHRGCPVAEVVGFGDPAGERQDVAFSESVRAHLGRNEQVLAPAGALKPSLPAQRADDMVGGLRADAEHVDDLSTLYFSAAMLCHAEDDAAFLGRQ